MQSLVSTTLLPDKNSIAVPSRLVARRHLAKLLLGAGRTHVLEAGLQLYTNEWSYFICSQLRASLLVTPACGRFAATSWWG